MDLKKQVTLLSSLCFVFLYSACNQGSRREEKGSSVKKPALKVNPKDGLQYVWIPEGDFTMGCIRWDSECDNPEKPRHDVKISKGFWMGKTEVTIAAFKRFVAATGHRTQAEKDGIAYVPIAGQFHGENKLGASWKDPGYPQPDSHPVVAVSWDDAFAYCQWSGMRLPTEAEWEYAARGGRKGLKYVWGDDDTPLVGGIKQANVADESAKRKYLDRERPNPHMFLEGYDDGHAETSPVASFAANDFGLYDMAGNVSEWCNDKWHKDYYRDSPSMDPPGPAAGDWNVWRGGSWHFIGREYLRVSYRGTMTAPGAKSADVGFRCAGQ